MLLLVLVEVAYVASSAVFLNSKRLKAEIDSNPNSLMVDYDFALSPLPLLVWVWGGSVRVQDSNIQMWFRLNTASIWVNPRPLFRREFEAASVKGGTTQFRFRLRRKSKELKSAIIADLPAIPGLSSVAKERTKSPPSSDKDVPWKVRFNNVHVSKIEEIWIEQYHFKGLVQVDGGFYLFPSHEAEVFPAVVRFHHGQVLSGTNIAMDQLKGEIRAKIDRFNGQAVPDMEIFHYVHGDIRLKAAIKSLGFANYYLSKLPWVKLGKGEGELDAKLKFDQAILEKGSELSVKASLLEAKIWHQLAAGRGKVNWKVIEAKDKTNQGELEVRLDSFDLKDIRRADAEVKGQNLHVKLSSPNLDFRKPLEPIDAEVLIGSLKVLNLRAANLYLPASSGLKFVGGYADLTGFFRASTRTPGKDTGHLEARGREAQFTIGKSVFTSDLDLTTQLQSGSMEIGKLRMGETHVAIENLRSVPKSDTDGVWRAEVDVSDAVVGLKPHRSVAGNIQMRSTNAKPFVSSYLALSHNELPGWLQNLFSLDDFHVAMSLDIGEDKFNLTQVVASGGHFAVKGWMKEQGDDKNGKFLIEYPPLAAGVAINSEGAHLRIHDAYHWYKGE